MRENVNASANASIDHDFDTGRHAHIAPGVAISGGVTLEKGVHVGTGASIIQEIQVGKKSLVGAGAVEIEDVLPEMTVVGAPAHTK
jgi:UDP-perosamine 4-acetyltransferase